MKQYTSESNVRPVEWDKTSSAEVVYHNTDVQVIPATEERPEMYSYNVTEYTNKEYIAYMDGIIEEHDEAIVELAEIIGG